MESKNGSKKTRSKKGTNKKYKRICKRCGKVFFIVNIFDTKRNRAIYCSDECKSRKYFINASYFDTITPDSSYWLGFIYGSSVIRNITTISIFSRSKPMLESFNKYLNSTYLIRNSTNVITKEKKFRIDIHNTSFLNSLFNHGMIIRDNLKLELPILAIKSDFIRGYLDSDNGFVYQEGSQNIIVLHSISITLLSEISNIIGGKIFSNQNQWSLIVKNAELHYTLLYNNSTLYDINKKSKFINSN